MRYKIYCICLSCMLLFTGCYTFTGASVSPDTKSIVITYFPNRAPLIQPTLSQTFTDALKDKFISQTSLSIVQSNGDLIIDGEITGYNVSPVAIQGGNEPTAGKNRLTITVNVRFTNLKNDKQSFESTFSRYEDFLSSQSLSVVEQDLIKVINEMLVDDIFNKAFVNW